MTPAVEGFLALILGLILGSFATMLIYRVPRRYSWIANGQGKRGQAPPPTRSVCPSCAHVLGFRDLVPFFSWLAMRGRCRHCGGRVPLFYPLTELGTALAVLVVYLDLGFSAEGILLMAAVPIMAALAVIDFRHMILPNSLILILAGIGVFRLLATFLTGADPAMLTTNFILGGFVYAGLALVLSKAAGFFLKKEALGLGDIKLFAVAGLWIGIPDLSLFCILAGAVGVVLAVLWQIFKKERLFPFGPALIASLFTLLLV